MPLVIPTMAQSTAPVSVPTTGVPVAIGGFYNLLCTMTNWIFSFLVVIAVIAILSGAFGFLTSGGNDERIMAARKRLTYALVGIAVAILARALILVVANLLSGGAMALFGAGC